MRNSPRQCRKRKHIPSRRRRQQLRWLTAIQASSLERRRLAVIAALAACLSLGLFLASPNHYVATTTLQLDPKRGIPSNGDASYDAIESDDALAERALSDIRSYELALAVVRRLKLQDRSEFLDEAPLWQRIASTFTPLREHRASKADRPQSEQALSRFDFGDEMSEDAANNPLVIDPKISRATAAVAALLKTRRLRNTLLITITGKASNPVLAAQLADTAADVYISRKLTRKKRAVQARVRVAEKRIAELRAHLAARALPPHSHEAILGNPTGTPILTPNSDTLTRQLNEEMEIVRQAGTGFGLHLPDARIVEKAAARPATQASKIRAAIVSLIAGLLSAVVLAMAIALLTPRNRRGDWPPAYIDLALTSPSNLATPLSRRKSPDARPIKTRLQRST